MTTHTIDYDRLNALLNLEYVQGHFIQYLEGGDDYDWIEVENADGDEVELYIQFDHYRLRIAIENSEGPGPANGFDDHRHFVFKLLDDGQHEILFQPVEVDGNGEDLLDTFPIEEQSAAIQAECVALFSAVEDYLRARNEDLQQQKTDLPPDMILNVLGNLDSFDELKREFETLATTFACETYRLDEEFSQLENDDRMPRSYEICMDRTEPSMTEQDWDAIEHHTASAYFIVKHIFAEQTRLVTAMTTARCISHLIDLKLITAAKIETAGLAHGLERWKELASDMTSAIERGDRPAMLLALYKMFVRKPIHSDNLLYTCGMQNLGLPEMVIVFGEDDEYEPSEDEMLESVGRFERAFLSLFGIGECDDEVKPYRKRPEFAYALGDLRHNPYGVNQVG